MGCLVFVFAMSIGLSWYAFGYLDQHTLGLMGVMLLPVVGGCTWVVLAEVKRDRAASASWFPAQAGRAKPKLELSTSRKVR